MIRTVKNDSNHEEQFAEYDRSTWWKDMEEVHGGRIWKKNKRKEKLIMNSENGTSPEESDERIYEFALASIEGIGGKSAFSLVEYAGSAKEVFELPEKEITAVLGPKQTEAYKNRRDEEFYRRLWTKNTERGIKFVSFFDDKFPERLVNIPEPPFGLFYRGELPDGNKPAVAIVGARQCSEYGRKVARIFGRDLAEKGVNVISGLAFGVDCASQIGALEGNGDTYAVMGCGPDICYPPDNVELYEEIIKHGGVISEYRPGTQPSPGLFPLRNRIISGLSDVVLVVEARKRSGTYITVTQALGQGKEVFTVPGRITDSLSDGCNSLIKEGAGVALKAEDILEVLPNAICGRECPHDENEENVRPESESGVIAAIDITPRSFEEIMEELKRTGYETEQSEVYNSLVRLQIEGRIENIGGMYRRTEPRIRYFR